MLESAKYHVMVCESPGFWRDLHSNLPTYAAAFDLMEAERKTNPYRRLRITASTVMNEYRGDLKPKEPA